MSPLAKMSDEMTGNRPLSPPHSNDGDYALRFRSHQMLQEPYTPPRSIRPTSREPAYIDGYGTPSSYPPPPPSAMYYSPQPTFVRHVNYRSTPVDSDEVNMTTRSGRTLGSPIKAGDVSRVSRSPRATKKRPRPAAKGSKKPRIPLAGPLSEVTKDYDLPVKDMAEVVNRSSEQRREEAEKAGKIRRPMNSFMLYRSAYAERVKKFCKENNHQVVSVVTGASWPMESAEIKALYKQYAAIDRDNHKLAHPSYKFKPRKGGKKRGAESDDSDSDGEWDGSRKTKRGRTGEGGDDARSLSSTPFEPDRSYLGHYRQPPPPHPSSYQAVNPHGPIPFDFGSGGLGDGYYQPQAMSYAQNIEDVKFDRLDGPYPPYDMNSTLISMPDTGNNGLLGMPQAPQMDRLMPEQMIDPQLAQLDPNYSYGRYEGPEEMYQIPRNFGYTPYPQYEQEPVHPGMATLTDANGGWPQPGQPGEDFDRELQNY